MATKGWPSGYYRYLHSAQLTAGPAESAKVGTAIPSTQEIRTDSKVFITPDLITSARSCGTESMISSWTKIRIMDAIEEGHASTPSRNTSLAVTCPFADRQRFGICDVQGNDDDAVQS